MTAYQASQKWKEQFCQVPTAQVREAISEEYKKRLKPLGKAKPSASWPCLWQFMYSPKDEVDHNWILKNIQTTEDCGFIVYMSEQGNIILGADSFTEELVDFYWLLLYQTRGLVWHKEAS